MRWERITIQRAKNGFIIKIEYYPEKEELYVIEADEEGILEVLKDVFTTKTD
jgi:hypothetical protein